MASFKQLSDLSSCMLSGGKTYRFDIGGRCIEEDCGLSADLVNGLVQVDVVSIVSSNGYVELCLDKANGSSFRDGSTFSSVRSKFDYTTTVMKLRGMETHRNILSRRGVLDGVRYSQTLFIYILGTLDTSVLRSLVGSN